MTILWLYRKFKVLKDEGHSDEDIRQAISSVCLAYDNMCHMDGLLVSKDDLPLPCPFNESWKLISKAIDRLHLRNHVDPKCKKLYNPDDKIPVGFNTMACEQTFIWASRYKKIICAMPHVHQFFFCTGLLSIVISTMRNVTATVKHPYFPSQEKCEKSMFMLLLYSSSKNPS